MHFKRYFGPQSEFHAYLYTSILLDDYDGYSNNYMSSFMLKRASENPWTDPKDRMTSKMTVYDKRAQQKVMSSAHSGSLSKDLYKTFADDVYRLYKSIICG